MGAFLKEDDVYVTSLLELLNLRFGRYGSDIKLDGIEEMKMLQKEFGIFKRGRSLAHSLRVLNVGGSWNPSVKQKWFDYLESLDKASSDKPSVAGGAAIVAQLLSNLEKGPPLPVYFEPHDLRENGNRVTFRVGQPLFFMVTDHLVVGLPMARRRVPVAAKGSKKPAPR
jgi:hypothetical protein